MSHTRLAYSISEACKLTSVGRTTLYAAIKTGDLKIHKVGRRTLVTASDLSAWLDAHRSNQSADGEIVRTGLAREVVRS